MGRSSRPQQERPSIYDPTCPPSVYLPFCLSLLHQHQQPHTSASSPLLALHKPAIGTPRLASQATSTHPIDQSLNIIRQTYSTYSSIPHQHSPSCRTLGLETPRYSMAPTPTPVVTPVCQLPIKSHLHSNVACSAQHPLKRLRSQY